MGQPPSGTVTFLFTDIEGSTRGWEDDARSMDDALERHDAIVREVVARYHGYVFATGGDGFGAVFARAGEAVSAAVDLQRMLQDRSGLAVRIGVHTGEAIERDGDYFGPAVNRAARLMALGHGGQILVSSATERLVSGVELHDLGAHRLRDLSTPERIFQLCAAGLAVEFPPLRSLDTLPGSLPMQLTSFVGRDAEAKALVELLADHRSVTLTGVGGVGKTRLALQVAAQVVAQFADGAWFCELAAVDDSDGMAQVVATTLGCRQRAGLSLVDSIVEYVKVRELLMIVDNCEHLLDPAGALAEAILRACPKVTVLATSREPLAVDGERVVRLRPLDPPEPSATGDELVHSAAVRLFADRAADAGASPSWADAQWSAVGEICRRVDGIPLAIELAAARVVSMSPSDIATHLDERFRLLTGKRRGRVERHQTLRATVEWSYRLLDEDQRAVFDRLGVFAGTFDAVAATAVAGDDGLDRWQVLEAISNLVAKSMLAAEDGPDATSRYSMNETLRQFARERLDETGEADRCRRRYAEHYATFAHDAGFGLTGPDQFLWEARLHAELDNVRAAVGWALDRETPDERELGVRVVAPLGHVAGRRPHVGIQALAAQAATAAESCRPELRAPVLASAAAFEWNQGRPERARALAGAALRDGVVGTNPEPVGAHMAFMLIEVSAGNYGGLLEVGNEARAAFETIDNPYAECMLLSQLASWEAMAGHTDQSRRDAERAVELARRSKNPYAVGMGLQATAWALQRGEPAEALDAAERYLDLYRGSIIAEGGAAHLLAVAAGMRSRLGDPEAAVELLRDAVLVARDQGARPQLAATLDWALSPLTKIGRPEAAATFVGALTRGALAGVGDFPGVDTMRARILKRVRTVLGGETTDELVARGAAMSYDEIVEHALHQLESA